MMHRNPALGDQLLLFARNFLKHPKMLGSAIPSSRFLIDEVLDLVDWRRARVIVEYGPGVGNFTAEILRRMRPDARLILTETNADFVRFLRQSFPDPRLQVVHGSATDVAQLLKESGYAKADYIISGIPFSTMPDEQRNSILQTTHAVLDAEGAFLVYQFSTRVLPDLKRIFGRVDRGFEPLNILPAHVFYCVPRVA